MEIITRAEARRLGLTRYYTGKACRHGHVVERFVTAGTCIECSKARSARYYAENPDKWKARWARYRAENPDKVKASWARYYAENPDKVKADKARYRAQNRDKEKARSARYYAANPDKARAKKLLRNYGLTEANFASLLASQEGGCAICGNYKPGGKGIFHVDHDHDTGHVRGLLCHHCNTGIGLLKDDPTRCLQAAAYLKGGPNEARRARHRNEWSPPRDDAPALHGSAGRRYRRGSQLHRRGPGLFQRVHWARRIEAGREGLRA